MIRQILNLFIVLVVITIAFPVLLPLAHTYAPEIAAPMETALAVASGILSRAAAFVASFRH
jgi:hypothetical protein